MQISILLPTYNESHNIIKLIREIKKQLPYSVAECIVVDDKSPDNTGQLVSKKFQNDPQVRCYIREKDKGLGTAIAYGLKKAKGSVIVIMDTDFNHQPKYLPQFISYLTTCDLVCGSRYLKGGGMPETPWRSFGSYLFNLYIRLLLQTKISDNLSGFLVVKKNILDKLTNQEKKAIFQGFGEWYIRFLWWAKKNALEIKEIPTQYGFRQGDKSKMNFFKSIIDYTYTVLKLRFLGLGCTLR